MLCLANPAPSMHPSFAPSQTLHNGHPSIQKSAANLENGAAQRFAAGPLAVHQNSIAVQHQMREPGGVGALHALSSLRPTRRSSSFPAQHSVSICCGRACARSSYSVSPYIGGSAASGTGRRQSGPPYRHDRPYNVQLADVDLEGGCYPQPLLVGDACKGRCAEGGMRG